MTSACLYDQASLAESARRLPPDVRNSEEVEPYIDPGFVNKRLIRTYLGSRGLLKGFDEAIHAIPSTLHVVDRDLRIQHTYNEVMLLAAKHAQFPTLSWLASQENPEPGTIICSTDIFKGTSKIYRMERAEVAWRPPVPLRHKAKLVLSTEHISSSTTKSELASTAVLSHISFFKRADEGVLSLEPLIIGGPWLKVMDPRLQEELLWHHYDFFQNFAEDIDEFSNCKQIPRHATEWMSDMQVVSELAIKMAFTKLLGDSPTKDWGGEISDHFSMSLHLHGKRKSAAFLLKGPARFSPMTGKHLGKNGDQLYRLAAQPAELLILQHSHEVTAPVVAQLRAFSLQPSEPRRYLIIDGNDTYRILKAYDLLADAVEVSHRLREQKSMIRRRSSSAKVRGAG